MLFKSINPVFNLNKIISSQKCINKIVKIELEAFSVISLNIINYDVHSIENLYQEERRISYN